MIQGRPSDWLRWHWRSDFLERSHSNVPGPLGRHERVVVENDPMARFSINILLNFTRPELSPLVLGPLAKIRPIGDRFGINPGRKAVPRGLQLAKEGLEYHNPLGR
ncbi:MAG: hypothetical protein ABSH20_31855 [Tepidisphaeraceae bacterium]